MSFCILKICAHVPPSYSCLVWNSSKNWYTNSNSTLIRNNNSRCDGEVGGRHWADFSHLLGFLQGQLLSVSRLFVLFVLRRETLGRKSKSEIICWVEDHNSLRNGTVGLCTLVSSCALAKLSTAMAKNTFSRVSEHGVRGNPACGSLFVLYG